MVLRCLHINKRDVIASGRSLRPGTMASVGPEVSILALSTPSLFYFRTVFWTSEKMCRLGSQKHLCKRANCRCRCVVLSEIARCQPGVSCFCAGPEGSWMCRKMLRPGTWMMCPGALWALLWSLVIHGTGSRHCPATVQLLAVQNKPWKDMHEFIADFIHEFSCIVCQRISGG